ncbi:hypothetical protein MYMA111404_02745 [Mycoplasma marinum]|uniref:Uncharacterized protein n=1 Tax=Mycoplasma marinum TaxID=1937190 RepID=A0A4R0XSX3_9MOLU|nr:hypothetical protein [Mycoplasma marinum]TCG10827.1 hypothetical protein C4B24_03805 [Mycoplasma marinum]
MKKSSKFTKLKIIGYTITLLGLLSTIAVGSYFIHNAFISKKNIPSEDYREMKNPKTIWYHSGSTNSDSKYANPNWDFQIKVFPYENGEYWLDEDGLKELRSTMKKDFIMAKK